MKTINRPSVVGSGALLAGRPVFQAKPAFTRPARIQRDVTVAAEGRKPSWKLDQPNRLWELGETWYPGADAPEYLDGSLPGDRGFDPARLFQNPTTRAWLVEGELYNGRVAMFAAAGANFPSEQAAKAAKEGILFTEAVGLGPWWTAPARDAKFPSSIESQKLVVATDLYMPKSEIWYNPIVASQLTTARMAAWPLPYAAGVVVSHFFYAIFELKRFQNFQKYGETGLLNSVPFDPLGLRSDKTRQNEVRNGRLAMLANLGFWSQAATTGKGPLENLKDHIADPTHVNIYTNPKVGYEATVAAVFIGILPIVLEVRKDLTPADKREEEAAFRPFPFL